jgi:membrane protein DedA with SNARE-associated domain
MHQLVSHWGYLALFGMCVISAAGIPLGTEFAIGYAGALSTGRLALHIHLHLPIVIAVATVGELCGSLLGYGIGRYGGRELVRRFGKYVLITGADLDRAERFFRRHGAPVVLFGRLIPVVRSFVSIGPGIAEMPVARFAGFSAIGCAVWCAALATLGFEFGRSIHRLFTEYGYVGYGTLVLIVGFGLTIVVRRFGAIRRERLVGS